MKIKLLTGIAMLSACAAMANPPTTSISGNLIGCWEFNGTLNGCSLLSNNPTNTTNLPSLTNDRCGNANSAASFNGAQGIVTGLFGPTGSGARSISFWMRTNNSVTSPVAVFDYGNSTMSGQGDAWQIVYNYNCAGIGLDISDQAFIRGNSCLYDGAWHHIVEVWDNSTTNYNNTKVYIDGVLQGSNSCFVTGTNHSINTGNVFPVTIGRGASSANRFFNGDLDDIYFYNAALTANDVQLLFNAGNCGISGSPCFCNGTNILSTPAVPGATYAWTLPPGWTGVPMGNTIFVTAGSGSGFVSVAILNSCGVTIHRSRLFKYCNMPGAPVTINVANQTYCDNSSTPAVLTANTTPATGVTYYWTPGGQTTQNISVTPAVPTTYTVVVQASGFCPNMTTAQVLVTSACCQNPLPPTVNVLSSSPSGLQTPGVYLINGNVTLSGNTQFFDSEFMIYPNCKITVPSGMQLDITSSHLYACGTRMWDGIEVLDGGKVVANSSATGDSPFLEDAKVGILLDNISPSHATPPLDLTGMIFNKNHVGIRISNADPSIPALSLRILGCVFTSRDIPFTSTAWDNSMNTIGGLRYAAPTATADLPSPYPLLNRQILNTKIPYSSERASVGIQIENFGVNLGLMPAGGVDIQAVYPGTHDDFNLFDRVQTGVEITNAGFITMNNVFQDMEYNPANSISGKGIYSHVTLDDFNTKLDLRPVGGNQNTSYGNRFWNCITGVQTSNVLEFNIEYGIFRTNEVWHGRLLPFGYTGIYLETNRFFDNIQYCEFNNVAKGIVNKHFAGPFNVNGGGFGIYSGSKNITANYFGAQVNSTAPVTGEFMYQAIELEGPNSPVYQLATPGSAATIYSNKCDRVFRGITINSMHDYPVDIAANNIHVTDEIPSSGNKQYGIDAYDNGGNLSIHFNILSSVGVTNSMLALVYNANNNAPLVQCNQLFNSYTGFEFDGNNNGTIWEGNIMNTHYYAFLLSNNGVIGPQGNPAASSGNQWLGTNTWETFCMNSSAGLSPLYVTPASPYEPTVHGTMLGSPYANGITVLQADQDYSCPDNVYPDGPQYRPVGIAATPDAAELMVYPNPTDGSLFISASEISEGSLVIRDLTGKIVYETSLEFSNEAKKLDLSLEKGIYFLEISSDKNKINKKVVVQ